MGMRMPRLFNNEVVLIAAVASIGNMLQGWDNASIAAAMFYIREEYQLQSMPQIESLVVAIGLIGAMIITTFIGSLADTFGRKKMLIVSSIIYFLASIFMIMISSIYMLMFMRLMTGFGIGLAMTIVPLYISEISPAGKRGLLNTFPQLSGSSGMCFSYFVGFYVSLIPNQNWRIIFGIQSIPSFIYFILAIFYLPESPKWLVHHGRADEAKKVLERLRTTKYVKGQMALLIEGAGGNQTTSSLEEYLIGHNDEIADNKLASKEDIIKLYGLDEESDRFAYPIKDEYTYENIIGFSNTHSTLHLDPVVDLIGNVNKRFSEESNVSNEIEEEDAIEWDEENQIKSNEHVIKHNGDGIKDSIYDPLKTRLIHTNIEDFATSHESRIDIKRKRSRFEAEGCNLEIGGGWQLAWKSFSRDSSNEQVQNDMQRMYIHKEDLPNLNESSLDISLGGKFIQAAAIVNKSVFPKDRIKSKNIDFSRFYQDNGNISKDIRWSNLLTLGVKRALSVAIGLQIFQQFAGINSILYYTPEILEKAGIGVIFSSIGLSSFSASILISGLTTLLMLPFIGITMNLMDHLGRRRLLLLTIPILILSLLVLVFVNIVALSAQLHAILSTISVGIYLCVFVMGFGPIPNILCSEIFPTNVRAICSTIYSQAFWIGNITVTYSLPVIMRYIGLAGVFGLYAIFCGFSFIFVYWKVPETRGTPVEVIAEFFSLGTSIHTPDKRKVQQPEK